MVVESKKQKRKLKNDNKNVAKKVKKSEETTSEEIADAEENVEEEQNEAEPEMEVEEDTQEDSLPPEEKLWFSKDFKMMNFRTKLRGNDFITELRHFLYLAETRPQLVSKYIEKRGKPLELAEAMERVDKFNLYHISYLCQALQLVLMDILSNQKEHTESAVAASRYFLKSHGNVVEKLLKSPNLNHRKSVLKLLTAIVCLEPQLGRQLLSSFDILSNVKAIEELLSHSKHEINETETVRKAYIHFILSYLVDGNTVLIRNILDKSNLIRALISGLTFDDHVTVCVVLSTVKKYILECPEISKTKKINVFDVDCVKNLVKLYDWRGPRTFAALFDKKKTNSEGLADPNEKQAVAEAAHEFLVVLLSSRKYGIAFDAMTNFRQKHNSLQGKIIGFIHKPWANPLKTELIVKILKACPELARHTIKHYASLLNPFKTGQNYWVPVADFIGQLISEVHPSTMKSALDKITLTDFSYWIKDICLSAEVLVHLNGKNSLKSQNYATRRATNQLLLTMYNQYCNYMNAILKREKYKGNEMRRFKFDILNHIFVNFPTVENILLSLFLSIQQQTHEGVDVVEHLEITLDMILAICKYNRSFVNKTSTIIDYLDILRPLYASEEDGGNSNVQLEMKAIKTILMLVPNALKPTEKLFVNVLSSFLKAFLHGSEEIQKEAGNLLRGIFLNTGLFENSALEVDLWLEALRFVDTEMVEIVRRVLIECLQVTNASVSVPTVVEDTPNLENLRKLFENIEKGLSAQGYVETITISKLMPLILKGVEIGDKLAKYLEIVCLLMFHYAPIPKSVQALYSTEENFKASRKYMASWLDKQKTGSLNSKLTESIPFYNEVYNSLIGGESNFLDIFQSNKEGENFAIEINGKEVHLNKILLNESMVAIYVQLIVFVVSQLTQNGSLNQAQSEASVAFLTHLLRVLNSTRIESELNVSIAADTDVTPLQSQLENILKYIYCNQVSLMQSFNLFNASSSGQSFLHFLHQVTECVNQFELGRFAEFTLNYREKIVKQIQAALLDKNLQIESGALLKILDVFNLSAKECAGILNSFSALDYKSFVSNPKTIFFEILIFALNRLAEVKKFTERWQFVTQIAAIYTDLILQTEAEGVDKLEDALYNFLSVAHHCIVDIPTELFKAIFSHKRITRSTVKLACVLLERDERFDEIFVSEITKNISKKELIYPLLNVAFAKGIEFEQKVLNSVYQECKSGFMKTIEKPQKAAVIYKENIETSLRLIESCMPASECVDFCKKNLKFDFVEVFQVKVIESIFKKAIESIGDDEKSYETIFVQYPNLIVQMISIVLKRDLSDGQKISAICYSVFNWIQTYRNPASTSDFEKILKSSNWTNFCKQSLKLGMQSGEESSSDEDSRSKILRILAYLCDIFYEDGAEHPEPGQFYEMIFSHSKFLDIVLAQQATPVKTEIMHLLETFARKNKSAITQNQMSILLGAYQAKLTASDRYTLALIQLYEQSGIDLAEFRPFIWGESAIAFYSLKDDQEKLNLQQQETSVAQVMSLIDKQVSEYTIANFPIWRKLDARKQLPEVYFDDPDSLISSFGNNHIEKSIENGNAEFNEATLRICPKRESIFDECYDPAFIIPLMSMCFAPEMYCQAVRPVQNGLLAITFAALSSQDKHMRLAAGCTQMRYRQHFENGKFFDKPVWIQAYDNIQNGLESLRTDWLKHKHHGVPRVPYIPCLFLAKTINLIMEPTSTLYKPLVMFLRLKNTFNFQCVPEFNVLFHSPEIEHQTFRQFIVEVIRDGVKCSSDLFLLVSTSTFKALMGFYNSTMSNLEINLLILSVLSTCVKIPASSKIMIEHVGIIPWLTAVISGVEYFHFDTIEGIINIISNLWYAIKANEKQFHNFKHIEAQIYRLLVKLMPNMTGRLSSSVFAKFLNILNKTAHDRHKAVTDALLDRLIVCGQKHFEKHVWVIDNIKTNGAQGLESHETFCRRLKSAKLEKNAEVALMSLRQFVVEWVK